MTVWENEQTDRIHEAHRMGYPLVQLSKCVLCELEIDFVFERRFHCNQVFHNILFRRKVFDAFRCKIIENGDTPLDLAL